MKKSEVQALYREAKKHRRHNDTEPPRRTQGCNTCGKVTWKPNAH